MLFLTTLTDIDNERFGLSVGAAGYIVRPFQSDQLREQVRAYTK